MSYKTSLIAPVFFIFYSSRNTVLLFRLSGPKLHSVDLFVFKPSVTTCLGVNVTGSYFLASDVQGKEMPIKRKQQSLQNSRF
jgi:hypothetical protein